MLATIFKENISMIKQNKSLLCAICAGLLLYSCGAQSPRIANATRVELTGKNTQALESYPAYADYPDFASIYFTPRGLTLEQQRDFTATLTRSSTDLDRLITDSLKLQQPEIEYATYIQQNGESEVFAQKLIDKFNLNDMDVRQERENAKAQSDQSMRDFASASIDIFKDVYARMANVTSDQDWWDHTWPLDNTASTIRYYDNNSLTDPVYIHLFVKSIDDEMFPFFEYHYDSTNPGNTQGIDNVRVSIERDTPILRFTLLGPPNNTPYEVEIKMAKTMSKILYGDIKGIDRVGTIKFVYGPLTAKLYTDDE